jgi:hypothetical protein
MEDLPALLRAFASHKTIPKLTLTWEEAMFEAADLIERLRERNNELSWMTTETQHGAL